MATVKHYSLWRTGVRYEIRETEMYEYSDYDGWAAWNEWLRGSREEDKDERPTCAWCGEPITDEEAYEFPNGDIVCRDCVDEYVEENFLTHIE